MTVEELYNFFVEECKKNEIMEDDISAFLEVFCDLLLNFKSS